MITLWLFVLLSMVCAGVASAGDPPALQREDDLQAPRPSSEPIPDPEPIPELNRAQGPPDPVKARQRLRELDRRLSVLESVAVGRG
ncbi:MAG TPA: hypothetical protein VGR71_10590, partial [Nitrospira sp.]|nr:hypothetical protein [Nitrospira sp.]